MNANQDPNQEMRDNIAKCVIGKKALAFDVDGRTMTVRFEGGARLMFEGVREFLLDAGQWGFVPNSPKKHASGVAE